MTTLAAALEEARSRRGLSKRAAAVELGCSEMSYAMWARGVWIPDAARAQQLAEFTGKNRVEILGLLGLLNDEEVATLMAMHRPTSPKARRRAAAGVAAAQGSATLPEEQGALLSALTFGRDLALVA